MATDSGTGIREADIHNAILQAAITPNADHAPPMGVACPISHAHPARGGVKKFAKLETEVNLPICLGDPLVSCPIWVWQPIHPIVCIKPVNNWRITIRISWIKIIELISGTSGYIRVRTTLAIVHQIITRRTPSLSRTAPL